MNWYYDSFQPESDIERIERSAERRALGLRKMQEQKGIEEQVVKALEVAEHNGTAPHLALLGVLKKNPGAVQQIRDYLLSRDVSPADDLLHLCMQLAYWRADHIDDVIDSYEPDNFLGFGKKAKRRRLNRLAAKLGYGLIEPGQEAPQPTQAEQVQDTAAAVMAPPQVNPMAQDSQYLQAANMAQSPSAEQAEAEIIGREAESESYDGEQDKLLPYINAALNVGRGAIAALKAKKAKGEKIDLKAITNLFKKASTQAVDEVKAVETKATVKEKMPMIIGAAVLLLIVGYSIGK